MDALTLSSADVREALQHIFQQTPEGGHRRRLIALFGTGDADELETPAGQFQVIPVGSELELRSRLPGHDQADAQIAYLVPWTGSLPVDIAGRFVQSGRIHVVGRAARLRLWFGAVDIDHDAEHSALARYLIAHPPAVELSRQKGRLTLDGIWTTWLCKAWDFPPEDDWSLESLLAWAATNARGPLFVQALADHAEVRAGAAAHVERRLGAAGALVLQAWEKGQGRVPVELAALFEPLGDRPDPATAMWAAMKAKAELGIAPADVGAVSVTATVRALGAAASGALRRLQKTEGARMSQTLASAEARVDHDDVRRALRASRWLPLAWTLRLDGLGDELAAGADEPTRARVDTAARLLAELELHQHFKDPGHRAAFERAEMALRLLSFLATRSDRHGAALLHDYAHAEHLARWYAAEGGFVDWARRRARGSSERAFGAGVQAVVRAVDVVRTELDRTFARSLVRWIGAGRPSAQIVPIAHAGKRFVADFLEPDETRRLLVLLMDGMAWAQAVELLTSLSSWGPVRWNRSIARGAAYLPVMASLPTITEVSRAAFFAGKELPPGRSEPTEKDVDRWAAHAAVRKLARPGEVPRVLLRGEGHTKDGSASREALSAVRDERDRLVAIVINAIDASLKGDPQHEHRWTMDSIRSLRDLLDAARDAGRVVLLCSDHGHVPGDRLESTPAGEGGGARYRAVKDAADAIADFEVFVPRSLTWTPGAAAGVALMADDAHRYGGGVHAGEHGGATLAEVVAPTILLGHESPVPGASEHQDVELAVSAPIVPLWWHFDVFPAPETAAEEPAAPPPPVAKQLTLIDIPPAETPVPRKTAKPEAPKGFEHPLRDRLAKNALFASATILPARRAQVLDAVAYLAGRDGHQAPIAAFAAALGVLATRAPNLVSALAEAINLDGYEVLRVDTGAGLVKLDVTLLEQLYALA